MSGWSLRWGRFRFHDGSQIGSVYVHLYGLLRGRPVPVVTAVEGLLRDGSLESVTAHGNRDMTIIIGLESEDPDAMAEVEKELHLQAQESDTELEWVGPRGGQPAVFRAQVSDPQGFEEDGWEDDEQFHGHRMWTILFRCSPFARSHRPVAFSMPAAPTSPTTATVSNADSTTGWTQQTDGGSSSTASPGPGYVTAAAGSSLTFTPAAPVAMGVTRFLKVSWSVAPYSAANRVRGFADGVEMRAVASVALNGGGFHTWFECLDASVAAFRFKLTDPFSSLQVFDVERSDNPPLVGSAKQRLESLPIQGSARTEGSIAISGATGLGDVQVFTFRDYGDGYAPPLSPFMGARGADEAAVSGASRNADDTAPFPVPLASFRPGAYLAVARVRRADGPLASVSVIADGQTATGAILPVAAAGTWVIVSCGIINIPDHDPNSSLSMPVDIKATNDIGTEVSGSTTLDEVWLFRMGEGTAYTRLHLGTGTPVVGGVSNRLWLDTPTLARPRPSLWRGTLADRSDARSALFPAPVAWDAFHDLTPPATSIFAAATGAAPVVSGEYTAAWHTHPGRLR